MTEHQPHLQSFLYQLKASELYDSEEKVIENCDQLINDVRSYLSRCGYDTAIACLDLAIEKKAGLLRQDGKTPSILHEVTQALYTISMIEAGIHIDDPESVIALNFIHDLGEDFGLKPKDLRKYLREKGIETNTKTIQLSWDLDLLTKKYKNRLPKFDYEHQYYISLETSQNASIAKLIDRIHNIATQIGVKTDDKCLQYMCDTMVIANDFVNICSQSFPEQTEAYKTCQQIVETTLQVSRYYHSRGKIGKVLPDDPKLIELMPNRGFDVPNGLNPILIPAQRALESNGWEINPPFSHRSSLKLNKEPYQFDGLRNWSIAFNYDQ